MEQKHPDYFEGILQLRNPSKNLLEFVKSKVKKDNKARISNIKKVPNGFDYYMTSQKYLRSLGKTLKTQYNGDLIISRKLFSKDHLTQKNVYRVNVMFRETSFKKGDTVTYKGNKLVITALGKKVLAKDIKTGKKHNISYKELILYQS